jgi:two-component system response regulator YesN
VLQTGHYDLLITDIRMPGLSGLQLIAAIRKFSNLPIIVTSGYDEFDYAKECLKHGVKDYLLKPVGEEEIARLLQDIKEEAGKAQILQKKLRLGATAKRDQIFKDWVHGYIGAEEALEQLQYVGVVIKEHLNISCLLLEMDFQEVSDSRKTQVEIQLIRFAVRNIVEELLSEQGYLFDESIEQYGVFFLGSGKDAFRMAQHIQDCLKRYAKIEVAIGIGDAVNSVNGVNRSFSVAREMLDRRYFLGQSIVRAQLTSMWS